MAGKKTKDEDILEDAREAFDRAVDAEEDNREAALDDIRFARLSDQWPEEVRKQREIEGRPCLTVNKLPAYIRQVVNDGRQNKPQIKVHPADSNADQATAEIINGLVRNIEYTSNADVTYDTALDNAVTCGLGYIRVNVDYACDDVFDLDIKIDAVPNVFSIYGDPYSTSADSSDWNSAFVIEMMEKDAFERKYKGAEAVDWDTTYRDVHAPWLDDDQVMVAEYWVREEVEKKIYLLSNGEVVTEETMGQLRDVMDMLGITVKQERTTTSHEVTQYILTGAEVLKTTKWAGSFIPIVPVYGEVVNVEGTRHLRGLVRDAKDVQRMFNFWRTASTELVALAPKAPFIGPKGAFNTDQDKWASANAVSHAFIEYDGAIPPQRQPFAGPPAGALQEALNAADDLKSVIGIFDAGMGAQGNETTGRAILARQRESDTSTFHFVDNLARAIRHTGRIIIDLIPKVYSLPRVVRILGEDKKPQTVPVNQQHPGPDGIERIYDLTAGKYDLAVEVGPSFNTKREESANQMIELIRAFPQAASVMGDLLAKNLDWPGADEIAKRMEAAMQAQQGDPNADAAKQQFEQMSTVINMLESKVAAQDADKAIKAESLKIDAYNAETNRLKAVGSAMGPQDIQALVLQTVQQLLASPDVLPPDVAVPQMLAPIVRPGPQQPIPMQQGQMPPMNMNP